MAGTKRDFNFTPTREYDNWHDYFADYAAHRHAINNPEVPDVVNGTVEPTREVEKVDIADAIRSAKTLANYAAELGFKVDVWTGGSRKFWRGEWLEQSVWHVAGKMGKSAFHMRWVEGKAQECRVQINGGPVEWMAVTAAKKKILEADNGD